MIYKPLSIVVKNLSFILVVTQLRSFSVFGFVMDPSSPSYTKREVYIPPDLDQMTSDARKWYLAGVANADKDITTFKDIAKKLKDGEDVTVIYKGQLNDLLSQAVEANDNTKEMLPQLTSLVDNLSSWTEDSPISFFSKIKLKAAIWYVNGKRDNKSYYLQNGAGLWCEKRILLLKPVTSSPEAKEIEKDLRIFEEQLLYARDELDEAAQIYVQGIAKLVDLVGDICKNEGMIRQVVKELKENGGKRTGNVFKTAQDSVDVIKAKLN